MTKLPDVACRGIRPPEYKSERNDCTVRALAIACDISYKDAHALLELAGRRPKRGVFIYDALHQLKPLLKIEQVFKVDKSTDFHTITAKTFTKRFPKGRYLVNKRGHAFNVVDGVLIDCWQPGSHIRTAFRLAVREPKED
jgi:hypothetical protein